MTSAIAIGRSVLVSFPDRLFSFYDVPLSRAQKSNAHGTSLSGITPINNYQNLGVCRTKRPIWTLFSTSPNKRKIAVWERK